MSRVEILQEMQLVIQEQLDREDIVLTEATKLNDLGVDSIELMEFIINLEDVMTNNLSITWHFTKCWNQHFTLFHYLHTKEASPWVKFLRLPFISLFLIKRKHA